MSRRLIDRDKYARHLADIQLSYDGKVCDGIELAFDALHKAPTIDAVELPLKIGEKCYCINHKNEIVEDVVSDYDIWSVKNGVKLRIELLNNNSYVVGEFGKTIFRTREEAQAAIEGKCER
jgi:hypothetical protein